MKKINWKVRINNKQFWLSLFPALLLLAQVVAAPLGYKLQLDAMNKQLLDIVNAVFMVLSILGIVNDPTTHSLKDSLQALNYQTPRKDEQQ